MIQYPPCGLRRRTKPFAAGMLLLAVLLGGCASQTQVSSVWHDKSQRNARFDQLLVVAVSDNTDRRLSFEDALVNALRGPKTNAWASARLMPANKAVNEESLRAVVAQQNADAVIVTKLESVEVKPVESGGRSDVLARQNETGIGLTPIPKPGTVFQYDYEEKIEPVYITAEYTAVVTTDVYSVASGANIHSIRATTSGEQTVAEVIAELSKTIAERLRTDGVVR
jgi:hypothetical protein